MRTDVEARAILITLGLVFFGGLTVRILLVTGLINY